MYSPDGLSPKFAGPGPSVQAIHCSVAHGSWNRRTGEPPSRRTGLKAACRAGLVLAWVSVTWLFAPVALALVVTDVAKEFICNCGCNKMLTDCDMQCGEQLRGVIVAKIKEGWDKPRIMDLLVRNYGEKLLAAPTKSGFNLTAWVTPFAAILVGGVMISLAVAEWVARRRAAQRVRFASPVALVEGKYLDRVDEELKHFD